MQVKKFEAPTIQEALETIKRELGPEAIILQTKQNKRGFGLMSKSSVEVTAAVSDRSIQKKHHAEVRMPEPTKKAVKELPANRQADLYDRYLEKAAGAKDRVELKRGKASTPTRYVDIDRPAPVRGEAQVLGRGPADVAGTPAAPKPIAVLPKTVVAAVPAQGVATAMDPEMEAQVPAGAESARHASVELEVRQLKRMIEELMSARDDLGAGESGGAGAQALMQVGTLASPALQDAFEQLVIAGVDRRLAWGALRNVVFELGNDAAMQAESVADELAAEIMRGTPVRTLLEGVEPGRKRMGPR